MAGDTARPRLLRALAILIGLMALSNFWKPIAQRLDPNGPAGFVFFGTRLHGAANAIIGPLFGAFLATYAYGVWTLRRWALPLAYAYAGYVILNLIFFSLNASQGERPPVFFMLLYALAAVGVSSGGAYFLYQRRDLLR